MTDPTQYVQRRQYVHLRTCGCATSEPLDTDMLSCQHVHAHVARPCIRSASSSRRAARTLTHRLEQMVDVLAVTLG
eukprot:2369252-Prymnesium_polylepis.1